MCTVTFLPISNTEFILTSNRDEALQRKSALPFQAYKIAHRTVYFPKDPKANGTWIAHDRAGYTLCLLNGAYQKHESKSNYKKSRGIVLLDFYQYNNPFLFARQYDFEGIEPFTLTMANIDTSIGKVFLYELQWDGIASKLRECNSHEPQIWSSVTLYSTAVISERQKWFSDWLTNNPDYNQQDILHFHHFGGSGLPSSSLVVNLGEKRTVSISSIYVAASATQIIYEDMLDEKLYHTKIIDY
jgi:hypothetical protein